MPRTTSKRTTKPTTGAVVTHEIDAVVQLRGALEELASDPRVSAFRSVRRGIELLNAGLEQLTTQQSAILDVQAAISSELAKAILRMYYVKDLHNVELLRALAEADLERFRVLYEESVS